MITVRTCEIEYEKGVDVSKKPTKMMDGIAEWSD